MPKGLTAKAEITINAPSTKVWETLTTSEKVKEVMFGAEVVTDWKEGSPIIYKGIWQGKPFEDKGKIITFQPEKLLITTHWSPLSGMNDTPDNYHTVTYQLFSEGNGTHVILTQDNNANEEEQKHSSANWSMMLENLKKIAEKQIHSSKKEIENL